MSSNESLSSSATPPPLISSISHPNVHPPVTSTSYSDGHLKSSTIAQLLLKKTTCENKNSSKNSPNKKNNNHNKNNNNKNINLVNNDRCRRKSIEFQSTVINCKNISCIGNSCCRLRHQATDINRDAPKNPPIDLSRKRIDAGEKSSMKPLPLPSKMLSPQYISSYSMSSTLMPLITSTSVFHSTKNPPIGVRELLNKDKNISFDNNQHQHGSDEYYSSYQQQKQPQHQVTAYLVDQIISQQPKLQPQVEINFKKTSTIDDAEESTIYHRCDVISNKSEKSTGELNEENDSSSTSVKTTVTTNQPISVPSPSSTYVPMSSNNLPLQHDSELNSQTNFNVVSNDCGNIDYENNSNDSKCDKMWRNHCLSNIKTERGERGFYVNNTTNSINQHTNDHPIDNNIQDTSANKNLRRNVIGFKKSGNSLALINLLLKPSYLSRANHSIQQVSDSTNHNESGKCNINLNENNFKINRVKTETHFKNYGKNISNIDFSNKSCLNDAENSICLIKKSADIINDNNYKNVESFKFKFEQKTKYPCNSMKGQMHVNKHNEQVDCLLDLTPNEKFIQHKTFSDSQTPLNILPTTVKNNINSNKINNNISNKDDDIVVAINNDYNLGNDIVSDNNSYKSKNCSNKSIDGIMRNNFSNCNNLNNINLSPIKVSKNNDCMEFVSANSCNKLCIHKCTNKSIILSDSFCSEKFSQDQQEAPLNLIERCKSNTSDTHRMIGSVVGDVDDESEFRRIKMENQELLMNKKYQLNHYYHHRQHQQRPYSQEPDTDYRQFKRLRECPSTQQPHNKNYETVNSEECTNKRFKRNDGAESDNAGDNNSDDAENDDYGNGMKSSNDNEDRTLTRSSFSASCSSSSSLSPKSSKLTSPFSKTDVAKSLLHGSQSNQCNYHYKYIQQHQQQQNYQQFQQQQHNHQVKSFKNASTQWVPTDFDKHSTLDNSIQPVNSHNKKIFHNFVIPNLATNLSMISNNGPYSSDHNNANSLDHSITNLCSNLTHICSSSTFVNNKSLASSFNHINNTIVSTGNNNSEDNQISHTDPYEDDMDREHGLVTEGVAMIGERSSASRCTHCGITFEDDVIHSIHMGCHCHQDAFTCNLCGKWCGNKYAFNTHIMRGHHQPFS